MGRRDRMNGSSDDDFDLEGAIRRARDIPTGPTGLGYRWHPFPTALPQSIPLPDKQGNPCVHIIGGLTIIEDVAKHLLAGCVDPSLDAEEQRQIILAGVRAAAMFFEITRPDPAPQGPQIEPAPANPPAPETTS